MGKLAIDDKVLEEVAALAKARGVPSERLAQEMLADALRAQQPAPTLRALLEEIASATPKDVAQTDSVELLREDRDR
jgi:antitoxin FitA